MIREIVESDIPFIVKCIQDMKREFPVTCYADDDPEYLSNNLVNMIDSDGFIGYMYGEGHGFMFGAVVPHWYCKLPRAYEQSLYVRPEYRGGLAAPRLIKQFVRAATDAGAVEVYAGSLTEMKVDKLAILYKRFGFERYGLGFRLRIREIGN
jgi:GNAT superfamily N-acetyltransferase